MISLGRTLCLLNGSPHSRGWWILHKEYQDAVGSNLLTQGQKSKREEELRGYKGEGPEKVLNEEVKKYAAQTGHELVLLTGVHFSRPGQSEQETDSILVDRTLGAVVVTEVKSSLNKTHGTLQHAINQVGKAKVILEEWFGDLLKSFKFIGTIFGETLEPGVTVSPTCSPFVMYGAGQILPKLLQIKNEMKKVGHTPATSAMDYRELVKFMLFCVHANKSGAPVDCKMPMEVEERVMEAGKVENIEYWSCWTPQQLGLMKSNLHRFVLLPSSMCTGKTECLVGKAIEKANVGEKVLFVIFGYETHLSKTLLYFKLKNRFEPYGNIVLHCLTIGRFKLHTTMQMLVDLMKHYPGHHVFTDEMILPEPKYLSQVAGEVDQLRMELEKDVGIERFLWIAVAGGKGFQPQDFSDANLTSIFQYFLIPKMKIPLRGTKLVTMKVGNQKNCTVFEFSSHIDLDMPRNLVEGVTPKVFTYSKYAEKEFVTAILQAMNLVNREEGIRGVALLQDGGFAATNPWIKKGIKAAGRVIPLEYDDDSSPNASEEQLRQWMLGDNNRPDLVTEAKYTRGWEEKTVVAIYTGSTKKTIGSINMYLRTISRLIIVKRKNP